MGSTDPVCSASVLLSGFWSLIITENAFDWGNTEVFRSGKASGLQVVLERLRKISLLHIRAHVHAHTHARMPP